MKVLRNPDKIQNVILKLNSLGKNCPLYKKFEQLLGDLGEFDNFSPSISMPNIFQPTFQFCDVFECFTTFRLVSKDWKFAVENSSYSHLPSPRWQNVNILQTIGSHLHPTYDYDGNSY